MLRLDRGALKVSLMPHKYLTFHIANVSSISLYYFKKTSKMNDKITYDIFYATIGLLHESSLRAGVLFLEV